MQEPGTGPESDSKAESARRPDNQPDETSVANSHRNPNPSQTSSGDVSTPSANRGARSRGRLWRLSRKELRETLRDRRTLITLVCMPLLIYPLLGAIVQKLLLEDAASLTAVRPQIALVAEDQARALQQLLGEGERVLAQQQQTAARALGLEEKSANASKQTPMGREESSLPFSARDIQALTINDFDYVSGATPDVDLLESLREGDVDVYVEVRPNSVRRQWRYVVHYADHSWVGKTSARLILDRLAALNQRYYQTQLLNRQQPPLPPTLVVAEPVEVIGGESFSLKTFIPLVLILMTVTGAVYPAIDLTAGERERGTLETLIAAPVPRLQVLLAKFLAVLVVALLTALVNLLAMTVTVYATRMEPLVFGSQGLTLNLVWQGGILLIIFAAFYSAILLALTSWARSFKEAQAYLIPLMLLSLAPGVLGLMPGLEMSPMLAITPLVNMVLLGRELLTGEVLPIYFVLAVISTAVYGGLALWLATKIFGTDAILYGSSGTVAELFRRPNTKRQSRELQPEHGLLGLLVMTPTFLLLAQLPGRFPAMPMWGRLCLNAAITIAVFVITPLALNFRWRLPGRRLFALTDYRLQHAVGACLLGLSLWVFVYEINISLVTTDALQGLRKVFESFSAKLAETPLAWRLITLSLIPAVCEELFFRGFFQSALATRFRGMTAAVITAILFGLFHVIIGETLSIVRFIPSTLLGLALGWIRYRSGSVFPGILLHAVSNGSLLLIAEFATKLQAAGIGVEQEQHLPWWLLLSAGICVFAGVLCVAVANSASSQKSA